MTEAVLERSRPHGIRIRRRSATQLAIASILGVLFVGNLAAIVWLWWHGGNVLGVHGTGEWLTSFARITGLLGAYSALLLRAEGVPQALHPRRTLRPLTRKETRAQTHHRCPHRPRPRTAGRRRLGVGEDGDGEEKVVTRKFNGPLVQSTAGERSK